MEKHTHAYFHNHRVFIMPSVVKGPGHYGGSGLVLESSGDVAELGETIMRSLHLTPIGGKDSFPKLLKRLGLRSLKAFERQVKDVGVTLKGSSVTVTPMVSFDRGGAGGLAKHTRVLDREALTDVELGRAVLDAYELIKDHPPLPKP